ncbi:MAG: hypothetical protein A2289_19935 [Deltaproteobacteria bacterium RIFOXYA12_FULL_58_15]|nr:MAG: hypothetical protein A2289_19935 [Deltaproteobacteria bacterium RIFOXYA12_FULL_58_15]OGR08884.1 MAG: hypothetical protein A2341_27540 [Deltaproteobacteria bacterium RIFOXYB12_FULL_58_9]
MALGVACGEPDITVPEVMSVDFYPPNGSVAISVDVQGLLAFSHEVADPSAAAREISLTCLGSPSPSCLTPNEAGCTATAQANVIFEPSGMQARVTATSSLLSNACYLYQVNGGVEAADDAVGDLPSDRRSVFRTN